MRTKRLARDALLTAVALIIFVIEAQIPPIVPIPGIKLGLANIITVCAVFMIGPWDALAILLCRIFLGSVFSGQMMALVYSLAGGLLCYAVMLLMRRAVTIKQVWVCSVFAAIAHNIGQMAAAVIITGTPAILYYLPALLVSAVVTGLFTGLCAQLVISRGHIRWK